MVGNFNNNLFTHRYVVNFVCVAGTYLPIYIHINIDLSVQMQFIRFINIGSLLKLKKKNPLFFININMYEYSVCIGIMCKCLYDVGNAGI